MSSKNSNQPQPLKQVPGMVLVKLYRTHPGSADVDTQSIQHQYYSKEAFDEYERENEEEGKVNDIHKLGYKYEVVPAENDKVPSPKESEIDVDGVTFKLTEDDGGFVAEQISGNFVVPITGSNKKKADLIKYLKEEIKAATA